MMPVIWLLGLSGSGKTTLGSLLRIYLEANDYDAEFIDGDSFRQQFGYGGFRPQDRLRNISAMREHALQLNARDKICIVAAITPYDIMRQKNREQFPVYREIWVRCGMQTLLRRDTRGLYARAMRGEVKHLSGVSDAFDEPGEADCVIDTDSLGLAESYLKLRDLTLEAIQEGLQQPFAQTMPLCAGHEFGFAYSFC
ncbi:MAG: adenylyl-sulfate kinase [Desulfovibrio sp.]|jgi:adenylylsulfate kinase-like enzyme|nr:adenylyl-sulfate kinase [Desulfovibrio sp.]